MSAPSRCHTCHHKQGHRVSTIRKPACQCECHAPTPSVLWMRDTPAFHPGEIYEPEDLAMFYSPNHEEYGEETHASS